MSPSPILWIDLQPTLHCFNQRLAKRLSKNRLVKRWSFQHDLDEACSIETIHSMMLETINEGREKYHLIGHGISGGIAHLFACKYPKLVHSATFTVSRYDNNKPMDISLSRNEKSAPMWP
jgi:pimeloyl-ACP methyl ester carboxylesterase